MTSMNPTFISVKSSRLTSKESVIKRGFFQGKYGTCKAINMYIYVLWNNNFTLISNNLYITVYWNYTHYPSHTRITCGLCEETTLLVAVRTVWYHGNRASHTSQLVLVVAADHTGHLGTASVTIAMPCLVQ